MNLQKIIVGSFIFSQAVSAAGAEVQKVDLPAELKKIPAQNLYDLDPKRVLRARNNNVNIIIKRLQPLLAPTKIYSQRDRAVHKQGWGSGFDGHPR